MVEIEIRKQHLPTKQITTSTNKVYWIIEHGSFIVETNYVRLVENK